ncbi:hypothetical protein SARC_10980 [Sphaeroforma arctica JP610]|uniref:Serine aminopeptidase S33 domain-containing protein n=1 Tax=Sphaeroforma arctica JP610 TaxID=667725 RepID=A0A0L0FIC2_9EUKA|nr:hypothetical protein SARC_10980 [Sphaeroforma arctica JP610]KNC76524.1 hypothetical protein SARC_10980 [Sphaeroforma arctica JP610]|eukprot:XP_014150426.1 hypothetical protein SARC_10980 [Sphaeroforma arctica JP610]
MVWPFASDNVVDPKYENTTEYFKNAEGLYLYYQVHQAVEVAKANVLLIHGLGEHCGAPQWQKRLIPTLTKAGFRCALYDQQGHGRSQGHSTAYTHDIQNLVNDAKQFTEMIIAKESAGSKIPTVILGHSMGGLITFEVVRENPDLYDMAIINGGAFFIDPKVLTPTLNVLSTVLSKVAPKMALPDAIDLAKLSRNPNVEEYAKNDTLRYNGGLRSRTARSILDRIGVVTKKMASFKTPVYFSHGEKDLICSPQGTKAVYEGCGSEDKTLKIWDEMLHEVFEDPDSDLVLESIVEFINKRI